MTSLKGRIDISPLLLLPFSLGKPQRRLELAGVGVGVGETVENKARWEEKWIAEMINPGVRWQQVSRPGNHVSTYTKHLMPKHSMITTRLKPLCPSLHHQWIVLLGASDTWQHLEFGRPFLPGWRTDVERQWCQRVYFRSRLPDDRLVVGEGGGVLHLIDFAGGSPSDDPFCHFAVFRGTFKMLVSSWWWNYVSWTERGTNSGLVI